VSGSWANNTYSISGTPTATGTFTYTVATTNSQSCTNDSKTGTITVNPAVTYTNCNTASINLGTVGFTSSSTWSVNGLILSSPVTATYCDKTTFNASNSPYNADCRKSSAAANGHLFSWCMVAMYAHQLCPSPWRAPTRSDLCQIANNSPNDCSETTQQTWGVNGWFELPFAYGDQLYATIKTSYYWTTTENPENASGTSGDAAVKASNMNVQYMTKGRGAALRCIH
jgi:uncharacterized protein (TIGR02145 family)